LVGTIRRIVSFILMHVAMQIAETCVVVLRRVCTKKTQSDFRNFYTIVLSMFIKFCSRHFAERIGGNPGLFLWMVIVQKQTLFFRILDYVFAM
jgi:hypothetical protein